MKQFLYNLLFPIGFIGYLPSFLWKLVRRGGYSHHFLERFGVYDREQRARLARLQAPVWIHAVSVGEMVTAAAFVRRWRERQPERDFVVTVTTTTGHKTGRERLPQDVVLLYSPLDFYPVVRRAFRTIRPGMLAVFEVEFWPNMILTARRSGIPVVLVNGRMSDRSSRGYARHRWFFRDVFGAFSLMCLQTDEDAARVRAVVGDSVPLHVCGTMKFDLTPDVDVGAEQRKVLDDVFGAGTSRIIWTAGSTHAGEEEWVVDAFCELKQEFPDLRLVLVPRHHERTAEVESLLRSRGVRYRLRRPRRGGDGGGASDSSGSVDVLLVNTTGELLGFYAVSDLVFVGKSLAGNHGGHNIIEPALFGVPVIHGPYMENFRAVAAAFRAANAALECEDRYEALRDAVRALLQSPQRRTELGRRGREVIERLRGAMDRTLDLLIPLLPA